MKELFTLTMCWLIVSTYSSAQVQPGYEYNTSMPYGTLDIRTTISATDYYYLQENKTFSFRESSPGVRTGTYHDMTSWESSPYKEGNLRRRTGSVDKFIMNYRLLFPGGYSDTYEPGYPMLIHMHGAVERANCYYENCFHATPEYTVEENSPPAPTSATHRLLNNDYNLAAGGRHFMDARNLAGTRQPDDPTMPTRAFPGFVLSAQMFNIWDSLQVEDVVRIARLLAEKYQVDEDRIYVQGLSIGGYAVYESMKRASWLVAAGLPMSGVWDANIFTQNQQQKVSHIPLWVFQGANDTRPSPEFTENIIDQYEQAGGIVRYTKYSNLGHVVWFSAYNTTDFYSWMLKQSKANLHASSGNTVINHSSGVYPKLMLAEGFLAYQWEKNGAIIGHTSSSLTVTTPGQYRARFSRKSSSPSAAQWNRWSQVITITETGTPGPVVTTMITNPDNGQTFTAPASINITATASVTEGSISKVEFYNGSTKLGEDATAPYAFTWNNVAAGNYLLTAKALDGAGNSGTDVVDVTVNPASGGSCESSGGIQAEMWTGISGTSVSSIPVTSTPSSVTDLTLFESPSNIGDNYGRRIRGFICVPTTGSYTFWIASDDRSELWLSSDANPANKVLIAHVAGWTSSRQWTKYATQQSAAVSLTAGQKYYIEALHKEGTGGDHVSVGWQLPGGAQERPIPGSRLMPFESSGNNPPTVNLTNPDDGQSFTAPASINVTATASDSDGSVAKVEFYNGGTKLGEDTTSPYAFTWNNVAAGEYTVSAKATDNSGASATDAVNITVNGGSSSCTSTGYIQAEVWTGISGLNISSIPVNNPPSSVSDLTLFETPSNIGDNYGSRVRGYVCVPATGDYTFWIASDDRSELWLSTDEDPANKVKIAYVSGWTASRQWEKYATQVSASIPLVGGQRYYIEGLLKEGTGGDHMAVGWRLPGGALERPIPGSRLSEFGTGSASMAARQSTTEQESALFSQINIYPNPVQSQESKLQLSGYERITETVQTRIEIFNMTGEEVFSEAIYCGGDCSDYLVNINKQLVPGVYIVHLKTNGARSSQRLFVK